MRSSEWRANAQLVGAAASHHMHRMAHSCNKNENGAKNVIRDERFGTGIRRVSELIRLRREQGQGLSFYECIWMGWDRRREECHYSNGWDST